MKTNSVLMFVYLLSCFLIFFASSLKLNVVKTKVQAKQVPGPSPGCAWLLKDCNNPNDYAEVCQDVADLDSLSPKLGFSVSQVILADGVQVSLFTGKNFAGNVLSFTQDQGCFENSPNDQIRNQDNQSNSVRVFTRDPNTDVPPTGCAYIYQSCGFEGRKVQFCESQRDITQDYGFLGAAIRVSAGSTVILYDDVNYDGNRATIEGDISCFDTWGDEKVKNISGLISSIHFKDPNTVKKPCKSAHPQP
jgi:hypothetical protein